MDNQNSFGPRKMYQGNWTCSQCGAEITELPFEPDGSRPIFCRDCHRQKKQSRPAHRRF
ncbi:MAG: CxxC-x17-CxxC domain-containing protein [Candidatus Buchananbacteria bacterium]